MQGTMEGSIWVKGERKTEGEGEFAVCVWWLWVTEDGGLKGGGERYWKGNERGEERRLKKELGGGKTREVNEWEGRGRDGIVRGIEGEGRSIWKQKRKIKDERKGIKTDIPKANHSHKK